MTFSNLRINLGNKKQNQNIFELLRFATDINYICIGAASKLLKHFINNYFPTKIISYADKRWSSNLENKNVYNRLNFNFIKNTVPNYWYLSPKTEYKKRENRFSYRKQNLQTLFEKLNLVNLYNKDDSEWQNMQKIKYDRIWDCGSLKYELNI